MGPLQSTCPHPCNTSVELLAWSCSRPGALRAGATDLAKGRAQHAWWLSNQRVRGHVEGQVCKPRATKDLGKHLAKFME